MVEDLIWHIMVSLEFGLTLKKSEESGIVFLRHCNGELL